MTSRRTLRRQLAAQVASAQAGGRLTITPVISKRGRWEAAYRIEPLGRAWVVAYGRTRRRAKKALLELITPKGTTK